MQSGAQIENNSVNGACRFSYSSFGRADVSKVSKCPSCINRESTFSRRQLSSE
jgi:hypothetical protein